ncbi:MAG: hypothetical protein ACR2KW_07465 [Rubrobacter sp.]
MRQALQSVLHPAHLRRTGLIALVVGTWLTAFNQGDVVLSGGLEAGLAVKVLLNYLTPFVVANLGLISKKNEPKNNESNEEEESG